MQIIQYLRANGFKRAIEVLWKYKIEIVLEKIINIFTKNKPLQNKIVIESHNDFDCNGGAFYNYLVDNGYNKKYKIVWLVRKKVEKKLPKNVESVPLYGPSIRKAYHMCTAKYFTYDCEGGKKIRQDQIIVYCSHGAGGLKNVKGKILIPDDVNYILVQSERYAPIQANQWSVSLDNKRLVSIGYPSHDVFFDDNFNEIEKITKDKFKKIILWMPTFRKGGGFNRNDSLKEQKLGIPLIESLEEYTSLNDKLKKMDILLIIKIHPKQDLSNLGIKKLSNIIVLTANDVKKLNVDNYRLMKCTDALISDYSGAAYDYLQLNKPIAYVLDDMNEYKIGFVVDDIHKLIAGQEIYNIEDMMKFIKDVSDENDIYKDKREEIKNYIYEFNDGNSCERLAKLLKL